jgi:hypothetical protein
VNHATICAPVRPPIAALVLANCGRFGTLAALGALKQLRRFLHLGLFTNRKVSEYRETMDMSCLLPWISIVRPPMDTSH